MARVCCDLYSESKREDDQDKVIEYSYSVRCIQLHSQPSYAGGACRRVVGFRQITPTCLPTFSKAAKTLSNCSSVWVAM